MKKKIVVLLLSAMCLGMITGCNKESDTAKGNNKSQNKEVIQENKTPENAEKVENSTSAPEIKAGEKFLVETELGNYNFTLKDVITPDTSSLDLPAGKKMIVITFNVENINFGEGTDTKLLLDSEAFKVSDENNTLLSVYDLLPSDIQPPQLLSPGYNQDTGIPYLIDENSKNVNIILTRKSGDVCKSSIELKENKQFDISDLQNQDTGIPYLIDENSKNVNIILTRKSGDVCKSSIELKENKQFDISDLQLNLEIEVSDNWAQIKGTYVNNSDYVIKDLTITYVDEATNETEYFGSSDTVLPGETSPISEGDTIDNKDVSLDTLEVIKYSIKAVNENGEEQSIIYDVKLNQYEVY